MKAVLSPKNPAIGVSLVALLLASARLDAGTLYWDATPGTADGISQGGAGTWDTGTGNWDDGSSYQTWNNSNNDTAVFGGTAGTVTLGADMTVGGLQFTTNAYTIAAGVGPYTLTLGTNADFNVSTGTSTITAALVGANTLTKSGSGTLRLDTISANFTGNISVTGGTLQVGNNNTTARLGGATYSGNISLGAGTTLLLTHNQTQEFSGIISGDGNLNKGGSGTLTLSGNNTYTGKTIIAGSGGGGPALSISSFNSVVGGTSSSSLGAPTTVANGTIQLGSGGNIRSCSLTYTGGGETTDRVMNIQFNSSAKHTISAAGSGLLNFTSNFTITPSSGTTAGGLYLRGSGSGQLAQIGTLPGFLEKADAGTWTIGGTNAANAVTISGGTLIVNGTLNATTTVTANSGTILGGGATIGGAVTINNGGTLSAGAAAAAGQLTFSNALTISATASTYMELGGTVMGSGYDNITLEAAASLVYGGNLQVVNLGVYDMDAASQTYDLFALNGGSVTGDFASVTVNGVSLSNSGGVWTGVNGGVTYSFDQSTGDLSVTAVPEPNSMLLALLGVIGLLRRRR